jgi:hypothetical protein
LFKDESIRVRGDVSLGDRRDLRQLALYRDYTH